MDELKTPQNISIQKDEARKGREKDDEHRTTNTKIHSSKK